MACAAEATSPTLSVSLVPPATLRFSWPSNFTDWQLISAATLLSTNWQAVAQTPVTTNNALVVTIPLSSSGYFRLKQIGAPCVFQATPPVITAGGSSTLTWCTTAGTTYRVSPGPGIVPGGSLGVSPTVTTVYTLTASNALGIVTNFTAVIVNPCGFASVTNWTGTLNFSYALAPSTTDYSFSVNRQAQLTFHLTRSGGSASAPQFTGTVGGLASINDREDDSSGGPTVTTIDAGTGPPLPVLTAVILSIDCTSNTYSFSGIVGIDATHTEIFNGMSDSSPTSVIAGQLVVLLHPLPGANNTISGSQLLPARGPFWVSGGDYYAPNDFIANDMFLVGAVTDFTAGNASVSWSFAPAP